MEDYRNVDVPIEESVNEEEELQNRLMLAMGKLPERMRIVLDMVILRGHKYREVSSALGISVNTVKYHLKEGLNRLRRIL